MPVALDVDLPFVQDAQIVIDAQADEAAWAQALVVDEWTVYYPTPEGEPEVHAVARLLVDDRALYLHLRVEDPEPARVRAHLTRRDGFWGDDWAGLYLDPSGEAQRAYMFLCNPLGVQADATRMAGQGDEMSWDGTWDSAGRLTDFGYELEIRVPWRTVRHPAELDKVGVSLLRSSGRTGERASWPARDPDVSGIIVQENLLNGPGRVDQRLGLSATPSLVFGWTQDGPAQERWGAMGFAPDLTLRFDPSPAVAGLLTVNPDFSQVETDAYQVEVNRRYALYLDEKRPFFTEGREWFEGPYGEIVYTRSMTTPRYGARTTVEADGWTVAALHVLDAAPTDSVSEGGGWGEAELGAEGQRHASFDSALRIRRALGQDSHLGVLYSDKTISGSGLANRVLAVDSRLRLADAWAAEAALLGSATGYASGEQALSPAGYVELEHQSRSWVGGVESAYVDEGFRAENGYMPYADSWFNYGWAGYRVFPDWAPVKRIGLYPLSVGGAWRPSDGALRDFEIEPSVVVHFANAMGLSAWAEREGALYQDVMLVSDRGGAELWGPVSSWLGVELGAELGEGPYYEELIVGSMVSAWGELELTPGRRTAVGFEGAWESMRDGDRQLYAGWVGRAKLELFATRTLWARLVLDSSALRDERSGQGLVAWEPSPGRAVYLGGGVEQDADEVTGWQVFSKLSWQFIR
jgi:hypothetical protein